MPAIHIEPSAHLPRSGMNVLRVIADGAVTGYVPVYNLMRQGEVNGGIQIQAVGTTVTPSLTLARIEDLDSGDAVKIAALPWDAQSAISANAMGAYFRVATGLKLVFAAAGEAWITLW